MRKKFLIIGLTGAIGSGCSEVSKFISHVLPNSKHQLNIGLHQVNKSIKKHFEFIKEKIDEFNADYQNTYEATYIGTEINHLFDKKRKKERAKELEEKLKAVNKNLRQLLIRRKILEYASKNFRYKFIEISMADLLVKLMLEKIVDEPNTAEFHDKDSLHQKLHDILIDQSKRLITDIKAFNLACVEKNWEKKDYCRFDNLFIQLGIIRRQLFNSSDSCEVFFQNCGDNARATNNPFRKQETQCYEYLTILAKEANKVIKYERNKIVKNDERSKDDNNKPERHYFVISSFRNPAEVQFFRKRYGSFYLCSLFATKETRRKNIEKYNKNFNEYCDERDAGKHKEPHELHKQDVSRCTLLADYAITTEKGENHYRYEAIRFLSLIDFPGIIPPRTDEEVMNLSYSLSLRSTCLSRQVGAVITNPEGFIIAAGWNSVGSGQLGCSQLCIDDYTEFSKDGYLLSNWNSLISEFREQGLISKKGSDCFCFKDLQSKNKLNGKIRKIAKDIADKETDIQAKESIERYSSILENGVSVKRLEYARALHAEENAILQAARFGGTGIAGGTIYTTTYPCELCSKKIYQAQLSRIVYTEPYPDSLSETLFLKDGIRQISIEQFEGVKSPSFFRLFKPAFDLKEYQSIDDHGADEDL
ncbi:deaminase [Desulfovibrio sp.]|uniref:deaminase n=1 Tax=Desulfovibrio sp. TaxID=885 RepID=UPI0035AE84B5